MHAPSPNRTLCSLSLIAHGRTHIMLSYAAKVALHGPRKRKRKKSPMDAAWTPSGSKPRAKVCTHLYNHTHYSHTNLTSSPRLLSLIYPLTNAQPLSLNAPYHPKPPDGSDGDNGGDGNDGNSDSNGEADSDSEEEGSTIPEVAIVSNIAKNYVSVSRACVYTACLCECVRKTLSPYFTVLCGTCTGRQRPGFSKNCLTTKGQCPCLPCRSVCFSPATCNIACAE